MDGGALTRGSTLAIHGGEPVRSALLPYGRHVVDEDDVAAVVEVLRGSWLTTGPKVAEFEAALASRVGARHAVVFASGTAALHAAMHVAGVGPGDEVVTTPLTFVASANAVLYVGGTPVFADVTPDTLCLDAERAEAAITPRTKAIAPVDYAGHPADMDRFREIADRHGLALVEDACHALGARVGSRPVGSLADLTVFSFHPVKHVTTGEGGAVATDDESVAKRLRRFRGHGIEGDARERQAVGEWYYEMVELGFNYRLSDLACALGLSQLRRLDANLARRREIAGFYQERLAKVPHAEVPSLRHSVEHAWHLYPLRLDFGALSVSKRDVFRALRAENVGVNVHYIPVHLQPYYRTRFGYRGGEHPVAEAAYERLLSLPLSHGMTTADAEDVVEAVTKVVTHYARRG